MNERYLKLLKDYAKSLGTDDGLKLVQMINDGNTGPIDNEIIRWIQICEKTENINKTIEDAEGKGFGVSVQAIINKCLKGLSISEIEIEHVLDNMLQIASRQPKTSNQKKEE